MSLFKMYMCPEAYNNTLIICQILSIIKEIKITIVEKVSERISGIRKVSLLVIH